MKAPILDSICGLIAIPYCEAGPVWPQSQISQYLQRPLGENPDDVTPISHPAMVRVHGRFEPWFGDLQKPRMSGKQAILRAIPE